MLGLEAVFERTWQRAKHWALVIVPPDTVPASVSEPQYVRALVENESSLPLAEKLLAWQSAVKRWPNSFVLQMGRGNAYYASAQYTPAAEAFQRATEIDPARAEAWNNLAYASIKLGHAQAARDAVERALILAPDNPDYRHSQQEIEQWLLNQ